MKMKKTNKFNFLGIIALVILISGCVGSLKPANNIEDNSGFITLDQALFEAAVRIDERIPAGSKIAPLNFNSPHDKFSDYVLEELTANLVDTRILTVVDRREIDLIRNEIDFQYSGDVRDEDMQQIGQMLGAQSIISGNFTDMGDFYRIMIRVLNVQNASVEVQYRANITSDRVTSALLTGGRSNIATAAPRQTVSEVSSPPAPVIQQQTPAASPAPVMQQPTPIQPTVPVMYTVTFNVNGATGTAPPSQTVLNGESITIPDVGTMINSIRSFGGWNTRADGNGRSYAEGDTLIVNANTQLYAIWLDPVYRIGETGPAGGLIFYDKGNNSGGWRYLEAAPADIPQRLFMSTEGIRIESQRAVGTGKSNTQAIMIQANNLGGGFGWAAQACDTYTLNGFNDWFLPSRDELNFMYGNLFMRNLGGLSPDRYWSSTFDGPFSDARYWWAINFSNGSHDVHTGNRDSHYQPQQLLVRPIRQF